MVTKKPVQFPAAGHSTALPDVSVKKAIFLLYTGMPPAIRIFRGDIHKALRKNLMFLLLHVSAPHFVWPVQIKVLFRSNYAFSVENSILSVHKTCLPAGLFICLLLLQNGSTVKRLPKSRFLLNPWTELPGNPEQDLNLLHRYWAANHSEIFNYQQPKRSGTWNGYLIFLL